MICPACGKANVENSAFCEQCGTRLQAQPAVNPGAPAPGPTPPAPFPFPGTPVTPPPSSQAGAAASALIASMSMGEKISGAGAVAAAVGFFLPWISVAGVASENGLDLAKASSSVYLTLLIALGAGALCYFSSKAAAGKKLMVAGYLVLIGGLGPPILLSMLFGSPLLSGSGIGLWLVGLGDTAIAVGGLMTIRDFSKRTY
jgi:zinc-ribbon domain